MIKIYNFNEVFNLLKPEKNKKFVLVDNKYITQISLLTPCNIKSNSMSYKDVFEHLKFQNNHIDLIWIYLNIHGNIKYIKICTSDFSNMNSFIEEFLNIKPCKDDRSMEDYLKIYFDKINYDECIISNPKTKIKLEFSNKYFCEAIINYLSKKEKEKISLYNLPMGSNIVITDTNPQFVIRKRKIIGVYNDDKLVPLQQDHKKIKLAADICIKLECEFEEYDKAAKYIECLKHLE